VTLSGPKLYGMTYLGGAVGGGALFNMNTDGTDFRLLHSFTGGASNGKQPLGALTLSGSKLYGMTLYGGSSDKGTLFSINTDGTGFSLLHAFTGTASDGAIPYGSLTLSGSKIYGMTSAGGAADTGTLFSMNINGAGFTVLHSFAGTSDGSNPQGSLTLVGSVLYGMTSGGGSSNKGAIFSIGNDGSGFQLLESFGGAPVDGAFPMWGEFTVSGDESTLYGMTFNGGTADQGVVFSRAVPEPSGFALVGLGALLLATRRRRNARA